MSNQTLTKECRRIGETDFDQCGRLLRDISPDFFPETQAIGRRLRQGHEYWGFFAGKNLVALAGTRQAQFHPSSAERLRGGYYDIVETSPDCNGTALLVYIVATEPERPDLSVNLLRSVEQMAWKHGLEYIVGYVRDEHIGLLDAVPRIQRAGVEVEAFFPPTWSFRNRRGTLMFKRL